MFQKMLKFAMHGYNLHGYMSASKNTNDIIITYVTVLHVYGLLICKHS